MQNKIVKYKPTVLQILNKHYKNENSYQGKYGDPKNVHGGYFLGNIDFNNNKVTQSHK